MSIAMTAAPPRGDDERIAGRREIADEVSICGVAHNGAGRDEDDDGVTVLSSPVGPLPGHAEPGPPVLVTGQRCQAVDVFFSANNHAAAAAAVAPVRPAFGNLEFAAETQAAVAAVPSFDENRDTIEEHGGGILAR